MVLEIVSVRCRPCLCDILRSHYIRKYSNEYKKYVYEWCKLHNLDETKEWNKIDKSIFKPCPKFNLYNKIL